MAVAKKFQNKPIVFVMVNSGNNRENVQSYVRKHRISVPVVVDEDRSFEQELGSRQISLQNIWNVKLLNSDGEVTVGDTENLEEAATVALKGARWHVSPKGMPKELQSAWRAIEMGAFSAAGAAVTKSLNSKDEKIASAAKRLNDFTQKTLASRREAAEAPLRKYKIEAFESYSKLSEEFKGFDLPDDLKATIDELKSDPAVIAESKAMKRLATAKRSIDSRSPAAKKRARRALEALAEGAGDTRAGIEAAELLQTLPQ